MWRAFQSSLEHVTEPLKEVFFGLYIHVGRDLFAGSPAKRANIVDAMHMVCMTMCR